MKAAAIHFRTKPSGAVRVTKPRTGLEGGKAFMKGQTLTCDVHAQLF